MKTSLNPELGSTGPADDPTAPHAPSASESPLARMHEAIDKTIALAPAFLRGDVDADHMANTMVHAVRDYVEQERGAGRAHTTPSAESKALEGVLAELMGCGSGYLAGRCDAACVARTMTYMVNEFGAH